MSDPDPATGEPSTRSSVRVAATYLLVLVLSVELAVWGAFTVLLRVGGQPVPLGIAVAVVGNVVLGTWGGRVLGRRAGAIGPGLVWLVVALQLASTRPEGDLVVVSGLRGFAFLIAGAVAALTVALRSPARRDPAPRGPAGPGPATPGARPGR
ncbi:MAG: hypothetical protein H7233_07685 [Pseudorhodobacter sp.]|nr:hypothetical protein [Frankiaceae bacterium]